MAHLDPKEIKVQSDALSIGSTRTYQAAMARQLRRGPWFALSVAIHGAVLVLVAELIRPELKAVDRSPLEVVDTQRDEVEAPPPPPPLEVVPEEVLGEVVVSETPVVAEETPGSSGIDVSRQESFDSGTLDPSEWTTVVGLDS